MAFFCRPFELIHLSSRCLAERVRRGQPVVHLLADQGIRCPGLRRHDERPPGDTAGTLIETDGEKMTRRVYVTFDHAYSICV